MSNSYTIVDVRTPEEYKEQNIKGSINIPLEEIMVSFDDFKKMQQPILLHCYSGNRSGQALGILKAVIPDINAQNIGGYEDAELFIEKLNR